VIKVAIGALIVVLSLMFQHQYIISKLVDRSPKFNLVGGLYMIQNQMLHRFYL